MPSPPPTTDATLHLHSSGEMRLLLWRRDEPVVTPTHVLVLGTRPHPIVALERRFDDVLDDPGLLGAHPLHDLVRLSKVLVRRRSVRPRVVRSSPSVRLRWQASLNAQERAFLRSLCERLPPASVAPLVDDESPEEPWTLVRGALDALLDTMLRRARVPPLFRGDGWESELERALTGPSDTPGRTANGPLALRSLQAWEADARERETPRFRLVLRLESPAGAGRSFRLAYALEAREGQTLIQAVDARDIWAGTLAAHSLADELDAPRAFLRTALRRAAEHLAPIEVSLASDAPAAAVLTPEQTWQLLNRTSAAIESTGARVEIPAELQNLDARFPRARVRVVRADGRPSTDSSLAPRYQATWEVRANDATLDAATLEKLAESAPLARVGDAWVPITTEAAARLALVAARPPLEWTGPQALAAALAGEVRQAGDLADALVEPDPGLVSLIAALGRDPALVEPPPGLQATLRDYQRRGLAWLAHRAQHGLGALLADDMGLGKTVQLIALLVFLADERPDDGPALVVCPASLVGNWTRELGRFAPSLRVVRHHGALRAKDAGTFGEGLSARDVILTTYGLARRDAQVLGRLSLGTLVLDEAQNIKNPSSAQSRAVRQLDSARRVALSGTPVENRLSELWSLMDFLNPGLLGPHERFRREISAPIERERDARALRWLQAATSPFLLRRLKSDPAIAPELPPKETIRVYCPLTDEQARLYEEAVARSLDSIDEAESGIERSGRVLRLLTELKQICNHPAHFLGDGSPLRGRSGKFERALEMLEEIVDSGERVLVFTQYVDMARLLQTQLERKLGREVPIFHGGLSLPEREALVDRFQKADDGPPILLMSLRAGGVGLNLTRASHVVHFDRWWNPAVEDQASDRAHRIGQPSTVHVHLLITMGTLEERIDRLLETKRGLADAVVSGAEAWLHAMTTDELRALVALGSDAAVESVEGFSDD